MQLAILKCSACGALTGGPRELCPACHASSLVAHEVEGAGKLLSWTVIRRPPQAFRDEGAYAVAVVALDAGVPVTGRLKREEGAADPPAGARVRVAQTHKGAPVFEVA